MLKEIKSRVPESMNNQLLDVCDSTGLTKASIIKEALRRYLKETNENGSN